MSSEIIIPTQKQEAAGSPTLAFTPMALAPAIPPIYPKTQNFVAAIVANQILSGFTRNTPTGALETQERLGFGGW